VLLHSAGLSFDLTSHMKILLVALYLLVNKLQDFYAQRLTRVEPFVDICGPRAGTKQLEDI